MINEIINEKRSIAISFVEDLQLGGFRKYVTKEEGNLLGIWKFHL